MSSNRMILEVPVETLDEARAAVDAGADQLELCASLDVGGLTPSLATLIQFAHHSPAPFVVMIRPRAGDFVYNADEAETMEQTIALVIELAADGVVFGALSRDAVVDAPLCRRLTEASGPLDCVFHRAFDEITDQSAALEVLIDLGFSRVLTSGGRASMTDPEAAERIAMLLKSADDRIDILPGGGIRPANAAAIIKGTGCASIHSSCRVPTAGGSRLDPALVAELRSIIDHAA